MHPSGTDAPHTEGHVLHSARLYDLFDRLVPFGGTRTARLRLLELADPAPGEKVLDVGCGTGTLAVALKSLVGSGEVHGIDASPEMIAVAKKKVAKVGTEIDFQVALIEAIPFPNETFDLVTSSMMLHHLPEDLKRAGLSEVRRVLKPAGRFVALDIESHGYSHLGLVLSMIRHPRGESMAVKLAPILSDAGFRSVEVIPPPRGAFMYIRAHTTDDTIPYRPVPRLEDMVGSLSKYASARKVRSSLDQAREDEH